MSEVEIIEQEQTYKPNTTNTELPTDNINQGSVAIESARARAEAQSKLLLAASRPRNEARCIDKMIEAFSRPKLAEKAFYSYNRSGSTVRGLSIRAAEEMARMWGNLEYGLKELSQDSGKSEMQAFCWDLETNTMSTQNFTNKHARDVKNGVVRELTSLRDIYEINANMGARRLRARILAIIPDYVVETVIEQVENTLRGDSTVPLKDRANKMVARFKELGVTIEMLEERLGKSVSQMTPDDFVEYTGIYNSIKEKTQSVDDWFKISREVKSSLGSALDKLDE